ncbi:MAG: preprotein translocase subunit SecG [Melioribacteraceae bacterium]|nr:preprotein translocase subunit SecG [Melioribacteraceae bacterium]
MYTLLTIIAIIASVLLVVVVLLQSSKGGGLAGITGDTGNFGQMFGTRRTADFLSKFTWWLGGIIVGLSLVINLFFLPGQSTTEQRESIIQGTQTPTVPATPALPEQTQSDNQDQGTTDTEQK